MNDGNRGGDDSAPSKLLTYAESFNDGTITLDVNFYKIVEKVTSVTYHFEKTSARVVILLVDLEVLGKSIDSVCEYSYLHFGRTSVSFVNRILGDDLLLFVLGNHYFHLS